jgi:hypothetical protein
VDAEEWERIYKPIPHPEGKKHGYEIDGEYYLIEPYESTILRGIHKNHLWSFVQNHRGDVYIAAGDWEEKSVEVIGYLHTIFPWRSGDEATYPEGVDGEPQ